MMKCLISVNDQGEATRGPAEREGLTTQQSAGCGKSACSFLTATTIGQPSTNWVGDDEEEWFGLLAQARQ
jgi:hypothetical protein